MKPILTDKSGAYPVYLYHPDFNSDLPSVLNEIHTMLATNPGGNCTNCKCYICPLKSLGEKYYCDNLTLFAIKYPELVNDYPELFL